MRVYIYLIGADVGSQHKKISAQKLCTPYTEYHAATGLPYDDSYAEHVETWEIPGAYETDMGEIAHDGYPVTLPHMPQGSKKLWEKS